MFCRPLERGQLLAQRIEILLKITCAEVARRFVFRQKKGRFAQVFVEFGMFELDFPRHRENFFEQFFHG